MNTFEDFILFIIALAIVIWILVWYPLWHYYWRHQWICETTYSWANYIEWECLIQAKK